MCVHTSVLHACDSLRMKFLECHQVYVAVRVESPIHLDMDSMYLTQVTRPLQPALLLAEPSLQHKLLLFI